MNVVNDEAEEQITQSLNLLKNIFGQNLLGVYLYGSSIVGGLQKYSDIDLFVVSSRSTTYEEKTRLVAELLQISGVYMKSLKRPMEITIVVKSKINPWHYPPHFDFQYGEYLRKEFEGSIFEPWYTKEMPDLALLITQILLASKTLVGLNPDQLLPKVPSQDFIIATIHALKELAANLSSDTRNVLLTYARIWNTLKTDTIHSKPTAADWAINRLPETYQAVMERARAICIGKENEHWDDIQPLVKPCADFMVSQINDEISAVKLADGTRKSIKGAT